MDQSLMLISKNGLVSLSDMRSLVRDSRLTVHLACRLSMPLRATLDAVFVDYLRLKSTVKCSSLDFMGPVQGDC